MPEPSPPAPARRPLRFERFSSERGLSQSIVEHIELDRWGFLWLATEDGLNRFDGYEFKVFRHAAGDPASLSYSEVKRLHQDAGGTLWVGTFGGLNRFDRASETFERFVHRSGDPGSLANDVVRALASDRRGNLWVGTQGGGLDRLEPGSGRFRHHRHDPRDPDSLAHDDVRALLADGDGRLWIGTHGRGLDCRLPRSRRFRHYRHRPGDPRSLSHDQVTALYRDRRGRLWVGTRRGLDLLLDERPPGRFQHYGAGPEGLAHGHVAAICEDDAGRLWIATDGGGLDLLDPDRGTVEHHRHDPRDPSSLSTDRILCCRFDAAGQLWVGTYGAGGLNKGDPRQSRFAHYRCHPDDPHSLVHPIVWALCEDREGILWVGTDGGLDRVDRRRGEIVHLLADPGDPRALAHPGVRVVHEGPSGTLWVGTNGGLHRLVRRPAADARGETVFERLCHDPADPASLAHDEIRCLYEDPAGALWIGTLGRGLDRLDGRTGELTAFRHHPGDRHSLPSDFLRAIHPDRGGGLWIGTQGGGLARFDPATGRSVRFRHDPQDPGSLSSDYVFSIWEDAGGKLWIATYGAGVDLFDPRTGRVERRYGMADGLPADLVYGVLGDDQGRLWLTSNKGLSRLDPRTGEIRTWDARDGLQDDEFNGGSHHRSAGGELFFGGVNGFNAFWPEDLEESRFEPPLALTAFRLAGRRLRPGELVAGRVPLAASLDAATEIRLSYRDRVFEFQFAALDFTNPRKNRYAYRLLGFDDRWHPTDASRRFAVYTNLPPADYRFEVRGTNGDGRWSRHRASMRVVIAPPLWGTRWFRALAAATAAAVVARSYRRRLRTVRLTAELAAARDAQQSIWPRGDPHLPGFEIAGESLPASEVGGDFFDYVWRDPDRRTVCIAVGDVAGKGMRAAMTAVMASGVVAAKLEQGGALEEVLQSVNRFAWRRFGTRRFTALCLASLDAATRELCWVNAGMTEPLLKSRGGSVRYLATPDPQYPLGIREPSAYRQERTRLADGDVLVLATDGVPEAQSPGAETYGYDALRRQLAELPTGGMSARQILTAVLDRVRAFAGGQPHHDDMTVVVVKALSRDPPLS